jgi:hypothetical protein
MTFPSSSVAVSLTVITSFPDAGASNVPPQPSVETKLLLFFFGFVLDFTQHISLPVASIADVLNSMSYS